MTEYQRLFLVQARTDFAVFELLRRRPDLPACHSLHYLQMATEMLGKAHAWKQGPRASTHRALVGFFRSLPSNRKAQRQLGYERKNQQWEQLIRAYHWLTALNTWHLRWLSMTKTPNTLGRVPPRESHPRSTRSRYGRNCRKARDRSSSI